MRRPALVNGVPQPDPNTRYLTPAQIENILNRLRNSIKEMGGLLALAQVDPIFKDAMRFVEEQTQADYQEFLKWEAEERAKKEAEAAEEDGDVVETTAEEGAAGNGDGDEDAGDGDDEGDEP